MASLQAAVLAGLLTSDVVQKCRIAQALPAQLAAGQYTLEHDPQLNLPLVAGRPALPTLTAKRQVKARGTGNTEGHKALLHAVAHIEFNAINLALDCIVRFAHLPEKYYQDWVKVAAEEAMHFCLLSDRLHELESYYGAYPAHNGLWEMAVRTADAPLARMALVPRVLEARGLDATPLIMRRLQAINDERSCAILEIILRDEIGHVAIGDYWFRYFCEKAGADPQVRYMELIEAFKAPWPMPPLNHSARLQAGFTEAELAILDAGPRQPNKI